MGPVADAEDYWARAAELVRLANNRLAPGVHLYEHINFEGQVLHITSDVPDLSVHGFDETVSSWQVVGDFSATGFEHVAFGGGRTHLPADSACRDMEPWASGPFGVRGCRGDIRNDMMSSVGVGTAALNIYKSPLYWPKKDWIYSTGSAGATYGFHFFPDNTYRLNELGAIASATTRGTWFTFDRLSGVGQPTIGTRNNTTVTTASPLPVPAPDVDYRYQFQPGGQAVDILFRGSWLTFS